MAPQNIQREKQLLVRTAHLSPGELHMVCMLGAEHKSPLGLWGLRSQDSEKVPDLEVLMLGFVRVIIQGRK